MFVNTGDFLVMPYELPDLGLTDNAFALFVEKQEKVLLDELLGKKLSKDFYDGFQATPPIEDRWKELALGGEYNLYDSVHYYEGIKAFMVPYIFAMWKRANYKRNAITGDAVNTMENAENISPSRSIVDAYNDMSDQVGGPYNSTDNFYGFVSAYPDRYLNWRFTSPGTMNIFNIGEDPQDDGSGFYFGISGRRTYSVPRGDAINAGNPTPDSTYGIYRPSFRRGR